MSKHRNKSVLAYKEPWIQEKELNRFRTIVSEVSYFVGNPVDKNSHFSQLFHCAFIYKPIDIKC